MLKFKRLVLLWETVLHNYWLLYYIISYGLQMYVSVDLVGVADRSWFLHAFCTFNALSFLLRLDKDCSFV